MAEEFLTEVRQSIAEDRHFLVVANDLVAVEAFERAAEFLLRVAGCSVERDCLIDVPELVADHEGGVALDWDFPGYSFVVHFFANSADPLVYVGLGGSGGNDNLHGKMEGGDVERAFDLLQLTRGMRD